MHESAIKLFIATVRRKLQNQAAISKNNSPVLEGTPPIILTTARDVWKTYCIEGGQAICSRRTVFTLISVTHMGVRNTAWKFLAIEIEIYCFTHYHRFETIYKQIVFLIPDLWQRLCLSSLNILPRKCCFFYIFLTKI